MVNRFESKILKILAYILFVDTPISSVLKCESKIMVGKCMVPGEFLCSPNGTFTLIFQAGSTELLMFKNADKFQLVFTNRFMPRLFESKHTNLNNEKVLSL